MKIDNIADVQFRGFSKIDHNMSKLRGSKLGNMENLTALVTKFLYEAAEAFVIDF